MFIFAKIKCFAGEGGGGKHGNAAMPRTHYLLRLNRITGMKKKRAEWRVKLRRSNFKMHRGELAPRVILAQTYKLNGVLERIVKGGCALSYGTLKHAADLLMNEIEDCLLEGSAVNLPIGILTPGVKGLWQVSERYDPKVRAQNEAVINYKMSAELRKALENPLLEAENIRSRRVVINCVEDKGSETINERLTPGNAIIIQGDLLLMNGDLPERGLYYLNAETGATVCHIPAEQLSINTRSEIITIVPKDLPAGRYKLRIVSQCTTSPRPMKQAASYTMKGEMVCGEEAKQP